LADYVGLTTPRPVFGSIRHGWLPELPARVGRRRLEAAPLFVWNARDLSQLQRFGVPNVRSVGAPFLYGVENLFPLGAPHLGKGTLVFPAHSAELRQKSFDVGRITGRVERSFPGPYSVSLFYQDLTKPHAQEFRRAGWRIVSFGRRSDPRFLYRLIAELATVEHVVIDHIQTAGWYAAAMGRTVTAIVDTNTVCASSAQGDWRALTVERWPELLDGVGGADAVELGGVELGREFMLGPDALAEALGWSSWKKQLVARAFAATADLRFGRGPRRGDQPDTPTENRE